MKGSFRRIHLSECMAALSAETDTRNDLPSIGDHRLIDRRGLSFGSTKLEFVSQRLDQSGGRHGAD